MWAAFNIMEACRALSSEPNPQFKISQSSTVSLPTTTLAHSNNPILKLVLEHRHIQKGLKVKFSGGEPNRHGYVHSPMLVYV